MNKKSKARKKMGEKNLNSEVKKSKVVVNDLIKTKPKVHPFAHFFENKHSDNKLLDHSQKPSLHNIPYRKKAV